MEGERRKECELKGNTKRGAKIRRSEKRKKKKEKRKKAKGKPN